MPLSEYERKMLEELEAQLADEDPSFADTLKPEPPAEAVAMHMSIRHLVIGLLVSILGIGVLVGGIAIELVPLGVLGAVILFFGIWYVTEGFSSAPGAPQGEARPRPPRSDNFMARQAQMWEKRRDR